MKWLAAVFLLAPVAAEAAECRDLTFEGASYTVCEVAVDEDLRLFHSGPDGAYGSFRKLDEALAAEGKALGFAMNAGMYHRDLAPVGLYVEDGVEVSAIVTSDGPGNFGLLPNGVFCIGDSFRVDAGHRRPAAPQAAAWQRQHLHPQWCRGFGRRHAGGVRDFQRGGELPFLRAALPR